MLTSNREWSTGLAAGFRAGARSGTVLLCDPDALGHSVKDFLHRNQPAVSTLLAMGGTDVLSTRVDADVDWTAPPSGSIAGRVTAWWTGAPLAGVRVDAYGADGNGGDRVHYRAGEATTSADGSYEIARLEPGPYRVTFTDGANRRWPWFGRGVRASVEVSPAVPARADRSLPPGSGWP